MKLHLKLVVGLAVLALGLVPAIGMADGPTYTPEGPNYQPENTPKGPKKPPKGHAYGYYCRGESKKHVKGEKGTAFSQCVKAMAQADKNEKITAKKACKELSKKHVKGQQGTPFSVCVKGVAQMRKEKSATVSARSVA
jgi:hypothetical protein